MGTKNGLCCSFCDKSQHEVKKLIASKNVCICDECIDLSNDILCEENDARVDARFTVIEGGRDTFEYVQDILSSALEYGRRALKRVRIVSESTDLPPAIHCAILEMGRPLARFVDPTDPNKHLPHLFPRPSPRKRKT